MTEKLKPCPFCAGKNPRITTTTAYPDTPRETVWYAIECNICDATGDWDLGESGALEKWNTRPGEDALQKNIVSWIEANNAATALINEQLAENERLRAEVERLHGVENSAASLYKLLTDLEPQLRGLVRIYDERKVFLYGLQLQQRGLTPAHPRRSGS